MVESLNCAARVESLKRLKAKTEGLDSTIQQFNDSTREGVALALDLGTTSLVGRLLSADGSVLAESRVTNPQRPFGADILTRLQRANEGAGDQLRQALVEGVRSLIAGLLAQAGCQPAKIGAFAAAGNPGICHLLLGLPVTTLIFPPHRSPLTTLTTLPAAAIDFGLPAPLQLFPAVSGFVGGDLVAVLYGACGAVERACGPVESLNSLKNLAPKGSIQQFNARSAFNNSTHKHGHEAMLVLDLGTNAEIGLWTGDRWLVTSAAAGPTFEAGNIGCGMPLAPGAVTDVQLAGDRLLLNVSGNGRPSGLCGSGLLALVAAARQGGLVDAGGRIVAPEEVGTNLARYLVPDRDGWALCFHRDARGRLCLTQDDVRQLQLAKGAVRAGVEVLLERAGLDAAAVTALMVTGAFGAALPREAVKGIAMLPEGMVDKALSVSNGVLDGLAAYLVDPLGTERLQSLLAAIKPLPLSGTPAFEKRFLAALEF